jgi:cytochrome c biogenesis protein CcdA/thiol-disulfide isomerase/thioredoxin
MIVLLGIAFLAGIITAISPCVLPILPIVLVGGAAGDRRRPFAIVAGLTLSFFTFTLFATWLLDQLGLPKDLLRNIGIALLFLLAASLIFPQVGRLAERPFLRFSRHGGKDVQSGFLLGLSLGLVFVPCAGPVLTVVTVKAASLDFGWRTLALTAAYSLGAAAIMLVYAVGGQRAAERTKWFRLHAQQVRVGLGVVMAVAAVGIAFDLDRKAQTALSDYTNWFQKHTEKTAFAARQLDKLRSAPRYTPAPLPRPDVVGNGKLPDLGAAPEFAAISSWLNTPGEQPLTMRGLRGKVVLIDFWTYSCINCIRTLPYLESWYRTYRRDGFVIVGVHTPEFAFEHELSNVRSNAHDLGVRYPVALDNDYGTWNRYANEYWPAEYLIDRQGHVRHAHFGEGEYGRTESYIRELLAEPGMKLPEALDLPDRTPTGLITPESYLGYGRLARYAGSPLGANRPARYVLPKTLGQNELAYGGGWIVQSERIVAGPDARLRLRFRARRVHLVLGGRGRVSVLMNGRLERTVNVTGDRLYTLVDHPKIGEGLLELRFSPGVEGYAFTFG